MGETRNNFAAFRTMRGEVYVEMAGPAYAAGRPGMTWPKTTCCGCGGIVLDLIQSRASVNAMKSFANGRTNLQTMEEMRSIIVIRLQAAGGGGCQLSGFRKTGCYTDVSVHCSSTRRVERGCCTAHCHRGIDMERMASGRTKRNDADGEFLVGAAGSWLSKLIPELERSLATRSAGTGKCRTGFEREG